MKYILLWITFPFGYLFFKLLGWKVWTFRKKNKWYYLPWFEKGTVLRPYTDIFRVIYNKIK